MSTIQLRTEISRMMMLADDRFLASIHSLLRSYLEHDESIVGFTVEGQPLTKQDLLQMVETSREEALQGKVITTEQLLADIETW